MENIKKPNCGARLDRLPHSRWHWARLLIIGFSLLSLWSNSVGGLILAQLREIGWATNEISAVFVSIYTAGMFFGSFIGGIVGDKIGRKKTLMLFQCFHITFMIIGALSPSMNFLIAVRFFMGFGLGALLVILFASFTEYMPGRTRGTWSSRLSFVGNWASPLISTTATFLVWVVAVNSYWRILLIIPSVLSTLITLVAYKYFPESPRWLESQGRYAEAEKIMSDIESKVEANIGQKLKPVAEADPKEKEVKIPYSSLLKGDLLKRVVLGSFVLIAMNVVLYTLTNWLPTLFLAQGINLKDSIVLNTMSMFGAPFGIFIATLVMDKLPRKVTGIGLLLTIATLGYFYSLQTNMTIISIMGFFLLTFVYMYVCYASAVYVPEIWPTEAKLRGSGLANSVGRLSGVFAPYAVAALLTNFGVTGVFALLGSVSVLVAIVIGTIGIETKGESIEKIGGNTAVKAGS